MRISSRAFGVLVHLLCLSFLAKPGGRTLRPFNDEVRRSVHSEAVAFGVGRYAAFTYDDRHCCLSLAVPLPQPARSLSLHDL